MKAFEFNTPIHTERLVIRRLTVSDTDVDDVHAHQSRPDVTAYMMHEPRDRPTVRAKLTEWTARHVLAQTGDYLQLAIELDDAVPPVGQIVPTPMSASASASTPTLTPSEIARRPVVIGTLYFEITSADDSNAEIGWAMHPEFQGKGYACEAASALLELAFDTIQLHRVAANLHPRNDNSVRLCLALGMRHEAHHVENVWVKGAWADTGIYAILDREWAAQRS